MRKVLVYLAVALVAAAAGYGLRGSGGPARRPMPQMAPAGGFGTPVAGGDPDAPVPVVAGKVEQRDVPIYLNGIGTVTASNTVQIKAREDGQLVELRFREGQEVKAGDVLAVIDQRPYAAALKQTQANLVRDQANLANARADLERDLNLKEYASRQTVDTQKALVAQDEAAVAADQALIDAARTNLDYTVITSPIDGRTGIRNIDIGNIVHAADTTGIVTVTQLQPIAVIFTLPADTLPAVNRGLAAGPLKVLAYAKDNQTLLAQGTLALVDNQIDQTTAMVRLKAMFANADNALWPGQFVNARLLVEQRRDALVVPATVVQRGPNGAYAWVIRADGTVEMRPVTPAQSQDGEAVIADGLKAGEAVVVDGQYKLQPGSKVERIQPAKLSTAG